MNKLSKFFLVALAAAVTTGAVSVTDSAQAAQTDSKTMELVPHRKKTLDQTRHRVAAEIMAAHPDIAKVEYFGDRVVVFTEYVEDAHLAAKPLPEEQVLRFVMIMNEPNLQVKWHEPDKLVVEQYKTALGRQFQLKGESYTSKKDICEFELVGDRWYREDFPNHGNFPILILQNDCPCDGWGSMPYKLYFVMDSCTGQTPTVDQVMDFVRRHYMECHWNSDNILLKERWDRAHKGQE